MRKLLLALLLVLLAPASALATPTARLTISPSQPVAGQTTTFNGSTSTCDRSPCTYRFYHPGEFDTADGTRDTSASFVYNHVDVGSETHAIELRVRNAIGQTSRVTRNFKVIAATPTPTPTGNNCMPDPSACGYPDIENVGVDPLIPRTAASGVVTLSTAGQVYENKTVTGRIVVTAPNVTIRNVKITNTEPWYTISVKNSGSWETTDANLTLDHVELNLGGNLEIKGIAFNGYTVRNSFIHNGSDCAHFGDNVTLENNLCVSGPDTNNDGWPDAGFGCQDGPHYDGYQSDGGNNIRISHNTIRNPCSQTSAILMSTNTSGIGNVIVENNLMAGGGYTLYCDAGPNLSGTNRFTGNRFARTWFPRSGFWGPTMSCETYPFTGNVWDDTGATLTG